MDSAYLGIGGPPPSARTLATLANVANATSSTAVTVVRIARTEKRRTGYLPVPAVAWGTPRWRDRMARSSHSQVFLNPSTGCCRTRCGNVAGPVVDIGTLPRMPTRTAGRSLAAADRGLALEIGRRIRAERLRAGLTQARLAEGRYTKAYISALENGLAKPSMAALSFIASRLELPMARFIGEQGHQWSRLEADLLLASADWSAAADAYLSLRDVVSDSIGRAEIDLGLAESLARLERPDEGLRAASQAAAAFDAAGLAVDAARARYWMATALYHQENDHEARSIL